MIPFRKYSLLAILIFPLALTAQEAKEKMISWQAERKLTWADFQGRPDLRSDAAASTATMVGVEYEYYDNNFSYKVSCNFSKNKSWVRVKKDIILSHEQGHFDIAEIFTRILHKEMSAYRFNRSTYRNDVDKIYDTILELKNKMQDQYDEETDYSRNKEKQILWLKKIERKLEELKDFANYN